jgi:integrator complex subunit 1
LSRIRQRYVGENLHRAHLSISSSLIGRLEQKSRQNSGLLQSLPSFTTIPAIRSMIAENLEHWLKSPALAGLARNLFSRTVNHMKNIDPPLDEDLKAIDSILKLKLKANQVRR